MLIQSIVKLKSDTMLKIIKTAPTTTMELTDVKELTYGNKLNDYFVFYYQSNNSLPIFLKSFWPPEREKVSQRWGFIAPFVQNYTCYETSSAYESIEKAMKEKDVYIVHKNQWSEIFLSKPDMR